MNIHLRVIFRMIRMVFIPSLIGAILAIGVNTIPIKYLITVAASGLLGFMIYLLYKWNLELIKQEDELKALSNKK